MYSEYIFKEFFLEIYMLGQLFNPFEFLVTNYVFTVAEMISF